MTVRTHSQGRASSPSFLVLGIFAVVAVMPLVIQVLPLGSLVGAGGADLVRRNSEAFVMMLLPLFWELFAPTARLDGTGVVSRPRHGAGQLAWILGWVGTAAILQAVSLDALDLSLDQRLVTLGEGILTVGVLSAYLAVTRSLLPRTAPARGGAPTTSAAARATLAGVVVVVVLTAYQPAGRDLLPAGLVSWIQLNVEAVAGVLLIGFHLDVVGPRPGARILRLGWYGLLVGIPLLVQVGALDGVLPFGLLDWIGRGTEAFLAALFVSVWFDLRDRWAPAAKSVAARGAPAGA